MKGIFVAGTDTDVGKTFVSALLLHALKHEKIDPFYYKPVASGGPIDIDTIRTYGDMTVENSDCPIIFETPCSPHLASEIENRPLTKDGMIRNCKNMIESNAYTLIEGAGGVIVPILRDGFDLYELMEALNLPVVLVTRAGVGTINHTLLTLSFLKQRNIDVAGVIVNGFTGSVYEKDNLRILSDRIDCPILGVVPAIEPINGSDEITAKQMRRIAKEHLSEQIHNVL